VIGLAADLETSQVSREISILPGVWEAGSIGPRFFFGLDRQVPFCPVYGYNEPRHVVCFTDGDTMGCGDWITADDLPPGSLDGLVGRKPPRCFTSNGCTHSPDHLLGADLRPACHIHDYHYSLVQDDTERRLADGFFYQNVYRCCVRSGGMASHFPGVIAGVYFRRVRLWGDFYARHHSWRCQPWEFLKHFFLRHCESYREWRMARRSRR
jgi:hypothetical protein